MKIQEIDTHGAIKGSYMNGVYDSLPEPGKYIVSTIDARLQLLGEELMRGKVGAAVAIEPSTGEILMMVSSPTYDPDELVGRQRGNHYMELLYNKRQPLFNRAVSGRYPPGSTFKLVQGLIGMQEGVLTPSMRSSLSRGLSGRTAQDEVSRPYVACGPAFCHSDFVQRLFLLRIPRYSRKSPVRKRQGGFDVWREYVESFGFGRKLDSDFLGEGNGYVPDRKFYDRRYRKSWNALTVLSLSIGQGELECTPLQMANLAAIVANRGYYYIPHIVRSVEGRDSMDRRFYEKHYTKVDPKYFEPIVEGMWQSVHKEGGTSRTAYLPGLDVCGKTGTAQNPRGKDHSTFLSFAPRTIPASLFRCMSRTAGSGLRPLCPSPVCSKSTI